LINNKGFLALTKFTYYCIKNTGLLYIFILPLFSHKHFENNNLIMYSKKSMWFYFTARSPSVCFFPAFANMWQKFLGCYFKKRLHFFN